MRESSQWSRVTAGKPNFDLGFLDYDTMEEELHVKDCNYEEPPVKKARLRSINEDQLNALDESGIPESTRQATKK